MKQQIGIIVCLFLILGGFLYAGKVKLINPPLSIHKMLKGISYELSGHTGFMKDTGIATISLLASDVVVNGNLYYDGVLDVVGSATLIPPNNASFTLTGLSEKNWSSLTNIPTTTSGLGITEPYVTTASISEHIINPTAHGVIANDIAFNAHVATYTVHGVSRVVDYMDIKDSTQAYPWLSNGKLWTVATSTGAFPIRQLPKLTVFKDKMWLQGGIYFGSSFSDVWYSTNGVGWDLATANNGMAVRYGSGFFSYANKLWLIGGYDQGLNKYYNDVWSSPDGITWTQVTASASFSPRSPSGLFVFNDKMWVVGGTSTGYLNDVWYSTDGLNWSCATTTAPLTNRYANGYTVYNNKMWMIGGTKPPGGGSNDVLYTSDGVNWTVATTSAAFSTRYGFNCLTYNNKMWLIAGRNAVGGTRTNDVWNSTDGITWNIATSSANFSIRYNHGNVVYNGKMWTISGIDATSTSLNDSWYSEP